MKMAQHVCQSDNVFYSGTPIWRLGFSADGLLVNDEFAISLY
jgi:hypothetical protein